MEIADKIVFIYKGEKWWEGNKEEIWHTDNQEINEFIFASSLAKKIKQTL
jgi:phospholipid/cholesterol/gamma-HCH transport system ATP-binding protein